MVLPMHRKRVGHLGGRATAATVSAIFTGNGRTAMRAEEKARPRGRVAKIPSHYSALGLFVGASAVGDAGRGLAAAAVLAA